MNEDSKKRYYERLQSLNIHEGDVEFFFDVFCHQIDAITNLKEKNLVLKKEIEKRQLESFLDSREYAKSRFMEIVRDESRKAKITINPCTGRITVKIPQSFGDKEKNRIIALGNKVFFCDDFVKMTYRGTVQTKNDGTFSVCMQTEDKKFNVRFDEEFDSPEETPEHFGKNFLKMSEKLLTPLSE